MTKEEIKKYLMNMREAINVLEKELCEDISEDGTLTVNVEDGSKVSRVFVCGDNHFGGLYYPEQESCEDAISRREAIKKITYNGKGECIPDYDCDNFPVQIAMKTVKKILRELPPVRPQYTDAEIQKMQDLEFAEIQRAYELGKAEQQKMGQWIVKSDKFVEWGVCSLCKENSYEPFAYAKRHFKYCPQCGSKMQEIEE